ncbi:hypothetical protein BKH46_02890 [Helicobacter sp. 12S02634-8]|uniref:hypothetical protein n=1 Tax=Helicobacter sp. 12S02634-8 TaxID=1476199 RepID=UPI000BA54008|nr:hypothetical protein [Helicobacter sp. 12S02634-8]PAF47796.1 hypothetical protein BKH46_02890 [Helicobacter sp. 12S02634-8]
MKQTRQKRAVFYLLGTLLIVLSLIYALLFTQLGNDLFKPLVQSIINKHSPIAVYVQKFSLRPSQASIVLEYPIDKPKHKGHKEQGYKILATFNGDFSLFSQNLHTQFYITAQNISDNKTDKSIPIASGILEGKFRDFKLKAQSNIADSATQIHATIKDFKLQTLTSTTNPKLQNLADLAEILELSPSIKSIQGIQGVLWIQADFTRNALNLLEGKILAHTSNAAFTPNTPNALASHAPSPKSSKIKFDLNGQAIFKDAKLQTNIDLTSPIGSAKFKQIHWDIPHQSLHALYELSLPDLKSLSPLLKLHLNGTFNANGYIRYAKGLELDFFSSSLGGKLQGKLKDKILEGHLDSIPSKNILALFAIPQVFNASSNGDFSYNLSDQNGTLTLLLQNGKLARSHLTDAVKKYTKLDLPSQVFHTANLTTTINHKALDTKLDMASQEVSIKSDHLRIDLEKNTIASQINVSLKNTPVPIWLSGNLQAPKVVIDTSALLKNQIKDALDKGAQGVIEKYVPQEKQEKVKNLLNGLLKGL